MGGKTLLKDSAIHALASGTASYSRGCQYYQDGSVKNFEKDGTSYYARVIGNRTYNVHVHLSKDGDKIKIDVKEGEITFEKQG